MINKISQYFEDNKFIGITPETKTIADAISPYFIDQDLFNDAVDIFNEKQLKNIPDNILNYHLKEVDVFSQIEELQMGMGDSNQEISSVLSQLAQKEFTYDWLEKNDPENLILGKLCSCCSHLDGSGYGIMRASIVDPNVQTMVIRNKNGDIIAKSTLFINPKEQYGVFNNVEIREDIKENDKQKIYSKYILGIEKFVEEYNKQNPNNQLKQINVGMIYNDLKEQIYKQHNPSKNVLESIDYGTVYGKENKTYEGDSKHSQYTLWENNGPEL